MTSPSLRPASIAAGRFEHFFHACAFFRGDEEEHRVMEPFVSEGLTWQEKTLYIVDPAARAASMDRLHGLCQHVHAHAEQLDVLTWNETYVLDGRFDKDRMLRTVDQVIESGKAKGFPRTRIIGQMSWAMEGFPGSEQLLDYEVEVNQVLNRTRNPAVCVYRVDRLSGSLMMDLLRVHPMTIVGGALYENPFYVPPDQMLKELQQRPRPPLQ